MVTETKQQRSAEHSAKISAALKGRKRPEEMIEKQRETMTGRIFGPNSWEAIQNQRRGRLAKKAEKMGVPVESLPDFYVTPELIEITLARHGGNKAATAKHLGISIGRVRYYDPRAKLSAV